MNVRTNATLKELKSANWFEGVGLPAADVIVVADWREAIASSSSPDWESFQLQVANRLREAVAAVSRSRFDQWNEVVGEVKRSTVPLVAEKTAPVIAANRLPPPFEHNVQWDVLHVCLEAEFSDLVPPGFYSGLAYWYASGRFPCGWRKEPAPGRLVIY